MYLSVVRLLSCGRMAKTPHSVHKKSPNVSKIHVGAFYKNISFRLFLFFLCCVRIVDGVMQSTAFLAFHSLTSNKVAHVYHVTELAYFTRSFYTLKQTLCLFVQYIQTVPSTNQTYIASYNTYVSFHYLVYFLHALGNQDTLFIVHRALSIPFWNIFIKVVTVYYAQRMLCCSIGINYRFNQ